MTDRPAAPPLRVRLAPQAEVRAWPLWRESFAGLHKDHRYHELVADTLGFDCRVLVVEDDAGRPVALQPCFFVVQDLVTTAPAPFRRLVAAARRVWPRLLRLRMLMIGCAAGEGDIAATADSLSAIRDALPRIAREHHASLIVWKDVPARFRPAMEAVRTHFPRLASMPATVLPLGYAGFDDYLATTPSHATRKSLRRKFRAAIKDAPSLEFIATPRIDDHLAEAHALYLQVFERSRLQFEKLTPEFLLGLQQRLDGRAQFFLWRQEGRLVAVSICLRHDGVLYDEYLGLDYRVAFDRHLYYATFRDVLTWALAHGLRTYASTPLNYEPKRRLGFQLAPLDLYVAPTAGWARPLLRLALPWLEPARAEPALARFREPADKPHAGVA